MEGERKGWFKRKGDPFKKVQSRMIKKARSKGSNSILVKLLK
jgi:hypothetical protein